MTMQQFYATYLETAPRILNQAKFKIEVQIKLFKDIRSIKSSAVIKGVLSNKLKEWLVHYAEFTPEVNSLLEKLK
jgi:hypothetical protein